MKSRDNAYGYNRVSQLSQEVTRLESPLTSKGKVVLPIGSV